MKEYTVHISKPAEQDIYNAVQYIDSILHNPTAADKLLAEIEQAFSSATFFPYRHPLVRDQVLASNGIRMLIINSYLALYTIDERNAAVYIIRFLYGKSNWQAILKNDILC